MELNTIYMTIISKLSTGFFFPNLVWILLLLLFYHTCTSKIRDKKERKGSDLASFFLQFIHMFVDQCWCLIYLYFSQFSIILDLFVFSFSRFDS
ncbi:hypothetical protein QL285_091219 [Trifolium repens]|nr:hypothetical protein QL285_091219 [Trifolium repens]